MDARNTWGDPLERVSPGAFTDAQRRRLEAVTAARGLLGKDRALVEWLRLARYIETGETGPNL